MLFFFLKYLHEALSLRAMVLSTIFSYHSSPPELHWERQWFASLPWHQTCTGFMHIVETFCVYWSQILQTLYNTDTHMTVLTHCRELVNFPLFPLSLPRVLIAFYNESLVLILTWASGTTRAVLCLVAQSCLTLCEPMSCNPPGSSVQGDSPGKNTGVGCHALLQGIFPTQGSN